MGSGTSRGKRVAPACVSEVNVTKTGTDVASPQKDSRLFKPLKIHSVLRNVRNRAQPDCHSEGQDSDFSGNEEDIDGELDTVMADYTERESASVKKTPPKKTFIRSKTYGLCHFSQEDAEDDFSSAPRLRASGRDQEPRVAHSVSRDVNKKGNSAFAHVKKHTSGCTTEHNGCLTTEALSEDVPTSEQQPTFDSCHGSSLTTPVILYDGSEEELMDTIEREFS
ncbi:uncharacterized protein LOC120740236 isoform X2 [Simochromis diagramma]|uniref:uncharacterized protein LOC120740236 isoform X2 n=1 Tax=Simochromis diagramma TaxID=43689 RepID=UPI001A7EC75E|nr:uncharacterized protein LOC120740236 isoform X2 [Simochromis diagramma]